MTPYYRPERVRRRTGRLRPQSLLTVGMNADRPRDAGRARPGTDRVYWTPDSRLSIACCVCLPRRFTGSSAPATLTLTSHQNSVSSTGVSCRRYWAWKSKNDFLSRQDTWQQRDCASYKRPSCRGRTARRFISLEDSSAGCV